MPAASRNQSLAPISLTTSQLLAAVGTLAFVLVYASTAGAQAGVTQRPFSQSNRADMVGSSFIPRSSPCWLSGAGCEESEFKAAEQKRENGKALSALGGLVFYAGDVWLPFRTDNLKAPVTLIVGGGIAWIVGKVWQSAHVSQPTWDGAVQSIRVGETKIDDVKRCLGKPTSTTSDGDTQTISFTNKMPNGSVNTVTVTARAGVVSGVHQASAAAP